MKDKFQSLVGMRGACGWLNDPLITHLSPTNHPLKHYVWKVLTMVVLLFTFGISNVLAAETILATFRITLSAAPTDKYASYSDDDATYTCNKVGSNSSSNYALVGSQYYMKLTANDAYVKIKLKTGSIAAGDKVYVYHNHTTNKNGVGFAMTQGGTNGATGNATANTEFKLSYTLTASDIAADGSISVYRQGSNLYVGRIEVAHPEPECDKPGTPADLAVGSKTYNSATFSWSAAANSDGYKVYVEKKSDKSKILDWTTCATTSYTATGLAAETEYTFKVKAIGESGYCELGDEATVDVTTEAAPSACPEGLSISGTKDYTEGQTISLTAALEAGNGEITYTWYKGSIAAGNEVGTGASFSKASCATSDAGNYYCVASKDACPDAESTAYAVTVEEKTCPTSGVVYSLAIKSGASTRSLNANTAYDLTSSDVDIIGGTTATIKNSDPSSNGKMSIASGPKFSFGGNNAYLKIVLDCPLQAGDKVDIIGGSGKQLSITPTEPSPAPKDASPKVTTASYTYTVVADDALDGKSTFYMGRAEASSTTMTGITITRPYEITFANGGHGTVPSATTGFEIALTQITDVAGWVHTGWTADKVVKVGGSDVAIGTAIAVDATAALSANTTFTAVWEEEVPTYSVTYKANNGTEETDVVHPTESAFAANMFTAPAGKMFNGWNTSATGEGASYAVGAAVPAATTVFAQWVVDPTIRLILQSGETYSINTEKFEVYTGTELDGTAYTVQGTAFAKNFKFGNTGSAIAGQAWANKFMAYDVTTNSTDIKLYLYNKNSGTKNLYYQIIYEGAAAGELQTVEVTSKGDGKILNIPTISAANGARVVFCVSSTDVRICQMEVRENGTTLPTFGTNGYQVSIPGRPATYSNNGTFDGFTIKSYSEVKFISGISYLALRGIDASSYVTFTTASNIQLQVTTANANKFYVCAANIGTSSDKQYGGEAGTHNVNLLAGTYYIVPTAGSSGGEVQITKLAFATAPDVVTVTFKDGASTLGTQDLFSGEKATALDPAPTKSGYRFVEWQLSGSAYDFDDAVTTNIELDAVWQKTWTVTFDSDGGSAVAAATVDDGQAVAKPADPTKDGFDFVEWQLNSATYNFASAVEANITLVATWEVAQDDATLSALSYNGNAIDVSSAVDVSGVQTYTVHLQYGSTVDASLISVTKSAESASLSSIVYNSENLQATFQVESGNHSVVVNYAIQFVIDPKRGTSIVKAFVAGGDQKAGFDATGIYGDKGYAYTRNNKKMDTSGKYVGVKLLAGKTFAAGDKLYVVTSTAADLGYIEIYEEAEGTNLIKATGVRDASEGIEVAELAGYNEFYIVRKASEGDQAWNGFVDYVEVTREMNPAIKSFKFGDDAATINEGAKTITIEVPFSTDVTALTPTIEAYGNNGATYTPSGAQDFTSPVDYVVTDAYSEFSTTYAVTVTKAAASTNADLASLAVAGYSLDFDPATTSYNIVLDYGTTVLPAITYEVAEVGLATAVKAEGGVSGATTITVTPEAGAGYEKVYTINFSVSTTPKFVIYDGSTMSDYAESGSDLGTGFAWTVVGGSHSAKNTDITLNGKTYTKAQNIFGSPTNSTTRYIEITIPEGYVAKFYLAGATNSGGTLRSSYISKEKTGTLDESIAYVSADQYAGAAMRSNLQLPGTYYYCCDASIRLYELSVQLYPIDYSRDVTEGRYGTICLPQAGVMVGAAIFELAYYSEGDNKIFMDQVMSGEMVAGRPYVFLPKEGVSTLGVYYTDDEAVAAGDYRGLYGYYDGTDNAMKLDPGDGHYILYNNQFREVTVSHVWIDQNRAYFKIGVAGGIPTSVVAPLPGRRRMSIGAAAPQVTTGMDELNAGEAPVKVLINGELFILRGDKMFDATGRLVK